VVTGADAVVVSSACPGHRFPRGGGDPGLWRRTRWARKRKPWAPAFAGEAEEEQAGLEVKRSRTDFRRAAARRPLLIRGKDAHLAVLRSA
jgi:hypothetical protein